MLRRAGLGHKGLFLFHAKAQSFAEVYPINSFTRLGVAFARKQAGADFAKYNFKTQKYYEIQYPDNSDGHFAA